MTRNTGNTFNIPYNKKLAQYDSHSTNVIPIPEDFGVSIADLKDSIRGCTFFHNKWKKIFIGLKTSFVINLCIGISILAITFLFLMGPFHDWQTSIQNFTIVLMNFGGFLIVVSFTSLIVAKIIRRIFKIKFSMLIMGENAKFEPHGIHLKLFYEYVRIDGWWYKRWLNIWVWKAPSIHVFVSSSK
jgi:hypothetical protein